MRRFALLSPCRRYRYLLWRHWGLPFDRTVLFVGLNPSTADEQSDDPTLRRLMGYARAWGFGGLCLANLFALRSTDPRALYAAEDPVGPENDRLLEVEARAAEIIVACWGTRGGYRGRDKHVRGKLPALHVLRLTRDGHPSHPLYLPKTLTPVEWAAVQP